MIPVKTFLSIPLESALEIIITIHINKTVNKREDIILTPHIAFYTEAAVKNLIVDALDATMDVLTSGTTKLRVN